MTDDDQSAVAGFGAFGESDTSVEYRIYRVAEFQRDVDAVVVAASARSVTRRDATYVRIMIVFQRIDQRNRHRFRQRVQRHVAIRRNGVGIPVPAENGRVLLDCAVAHVSPCIIVVKHDAYGFIVRGQRIDDYRAAQFAHRRYGRNRARTVGFAATITLSPAFSVSCAYASAQHNASAADTIIPVILLFVITLQ